MRALGRLMTVTLQAHGRDSVELTIYLCGTNKALRQLGLPNTQRAPCPCIFKFGNCCGAEHSFERDRSPQVRRELVSRVPSVHHAHVINNGFVTPILGAATSPISCDHLSTCVKGRGITASNFAASRISHRP